MSKGRLATRRAGGGKCREKAFCKISANASRSEGFLDKYVTLLPCHQIEGGLQISRQSVK
jgi:hypothetical protein